MPKIWKLKSKIPDNDAGVLKDYSEFLRQLLYNRGVVEKPLAEDFLNPQYGNLHDPFLFKDMKKAAERVLKAIEAGEKITVYGDYDADAVTANAVLQQTFRHLGASADSYIPDRFTEGYGVNLDALRKIKESGAKVIITVDCGTNSHDAAEFCKNNGIDLIITDHHEIISGAPKAFALINPKNPEDGYPYSEITGVGVAFKLACGILSLGKFKDGWEKWLLDLVAIGTVADCHSLVGENRILVKYGLKVLLKTKWEGLKALMSCSGLDLTQKLPDTYTLGFIIAPRLNAAGRLEHANVALELLTETDPALAMEKALRLESINQRRQQLTQTVLSEAKEKAMVIQDRKILALVGEGWPKGVMGLVAGKLAEEYYKPVIVLEQTEGLCTGSARTAGEFDLIEALKFSSEHLLKFGGHKQAAGLTLERGSFELFYQKILEHADTFMTQGPTDKVLELEAELSENELNVETVRMISMLEPFGVNNAKPKFLISGATVISQRQVGKEGKHLQLQLKVGSKAVQAIGFNLRPLESARIDIAGELIEDEWNGASNLKLRIVDTRPCI